MVISSNFVTFGHLVALICMLISLFFVPSS
jgi:hypothetical protein